jgi:hypothetical protein
VGLLEHEASDFRTPPRPPRDRGPPLRAGEPGQTQAEARIAVFDFIEGFYNRRHRHSSIGYLSPIDYERLHAANPDAHQSAAVLAAVKGKPSRRLDWGRGGIRLLLPSLSKQDGDATDLQGLRDLRRPHAFCSQLPRPTRRAVWAVNSVENGSICVRRQTPRRIDC